MPDFGKVIGTFKTPIVDNSDPDSVPQIVALSGTISFMLNVARATDTNNISDPMVLVSTPITGVLNTSGELCTPLADGSAGAEGLWLVATDDAELNPTGLEYTVTYNLQVPGGLLAAVPSHNIAVPQGSTVDLALVIPPVGAPPIGVAAAEAAAAIAVNALSTMVVSEDIREIVVVAESVWAAMPLPRPSDIMYVTY